MGATTPTERADIVVASLGDLNTDVYTYEIAYARMRARDERRERRLGLSVVILSTIVGGSVFASVATNPNAWVKVLVGSLSLLAAVCAAGNNWAPFIGASERLRKAERACADIRTRVLDARNRVRIGMMTPEAGETEWKKLRNEYKDATEGTDTPAVPEGVYADARRTAERDANT